MMDWGFFGAVLGSVMLILGGLAALFFVLVVIPLSFLGGAAYIIDWIFF